MRVKLATAVIALTVLGVIAFTRVLADQGPWQSTYYCAPGNGAVNCPACPPKDPEDYTPEDY